MYLFKAFAKKRSAQLKLKIYYILYHSWSADLLKSFSYVDISYIVIH